MTLKDKIYKLIDEIATDQANMSRNFVVLGSSLLQARESREWQKWGFDSWGAFIDSVREKLDTSRARLYGLVSVAEKLLPSISESQLETMGISKALELKRACKDGNAPADHLIDAALNPEVRVSQLRADIHRELHEPEPDRGSKYYDWGGFYASPEEKELLDRAVGYTVTALGLTKETPDHVKRRTVLIAWAEEFLSSEVAMQEASRAK